MPRRSILSTADRINLLALPDTADELIRHYTFSETDLSLIRQRRGDANRLGVAVQLCLLRFPGQACYSMPSCQCCNGSDGNCASTPRVGHNMPGGHYLSPLCDYLWHRRAKIGAGKFRPPT